MVKRIIKILLVVILVIVVIAGTSFFVVKKLDEKEFEASLHYPAYRYKEPMLIPSLFLNGQRFYLKVQAENGDTLLAYCDSGGGECMINTDVIARLKLSDAVRHALMRGIMPMKYMPFRQVIKDERIPEPVALNGHILRRPFARTYEPFFYVPAENEEEVNFIKKVMRFDLFLAQNFFMGKAWTFDYPNRQVWINTPVNIAEANSPDVQRLGFRKNSKGEKIFGHPSMKIVVDGEVIDVLFDTGASIILSEDGKKQLHTTDKTMGGSFIAKSIYDKWRKQHADWKVYPKADYGKDIIEVPKVSISGHEVGPVLFAVRNDENWSQGMIHTMDKVVKGAIGGSAFQYLKVMIDYNTELAKFTL